MNTLELIEQKLGRRLNPADQGRITHLNDVTIELVEQARALDSPLLATAMLAYFTSAECHPFLKRYVQDVVLGNVAPQLWRRGRILVPSLSLEEQLLQDANKILVPLGGIFHRRIVPRLDAWQAGVAWVGAPAKTEPDADYRSPIPNNTASLEAPPTEPVADQTVALRRWIAGRLANTLRATGRLGRASTLSELAVGLPLPDEWSEDARIAAGALLKEFRELGPGQSDIPGFRGLDQWYRDDT